MQQAALRGAACQLIFEDNMSGTKIDRPQLTAMLKEARPGDTIVVWKLDRLGRKTVDLLNLVEQLELRDVHFQCLTQGFDTGGAMGKLMLGVLASFAELERNMIKERTEAGLRIAQEKGRFGGRRRILTGKKLERAKALWDNPPISPKTGRKMNRFELAAMLGVSKMTLTRECMHGGVPVQQKLRDRFLQLHPDVDQWLALTEDPLYGRNLDKLERNRPWSLTSRIQLGAVPHDSLPELRV
jgi:DNA invertase Pin-like site-specific DNA recombinase